MAQLKIKGEYVGPGEQKAAEYLRDNLPDEWVAFVGRKLPGANRDDTDFIVVGDRAIFVLEEKYWGPQIVADDNIWYVNGDARPNPLNRIAQLAKKVAGDLRNNAKGYKALKGRRVLPVVVLSNDKVNVFSGQNHDSEEVVLRLDESAQSLIQRNHGFDPLGSCRAAVLKYLDDMPTRQKDDTLEGFLLQDRLDVPGLELAYRATSPEGLPVILKCYPKQQFDAAGDPIEFLRRETKAINRLAQLNRTWQALSLITSEAHQLYIVPVVPPASGRSLAESISKPGPERDAGQVDDQVARNVVVDAFTALHELHELGLLHRALHPRRIWLAKQLRVMFSDLHLARIPDSQTIAAWEPDGDISEDYRAAEVLPGLGMATQASDVFSMVLCMSEWLLGQDVRELTHNEIRDRVLARHPWAEPMFDGLATRVSARPTALDLAEAMALKPEMAPGSATAATDGDRFEVHGLVAGRYKILSKLGQGGFGISWEVFDEQIQQRRVLKQFHQAVPAQLKAEFHAADGLNHDRCGRVYDMQLIDEPMYLVSEYVEGEPLSVPGSRSVDELRTIALNVLEGLEYIHGKHLVHGDVTPANIIVRMDGRGDAKLIDFGLATRTGERPPGWNPKFAAPEVLAGGVTTEVTDLYGLGVTMAFTMLGRPATRAVDGQVEVLPATDEELGTWDAEGQALLGVFMSAVDVDMDKRPGSAVELAQVLRSVAPAPPIAPPSVELDLTRRENPTVEAVRRLYRASTAGNAGNRGLDDEFAVATYVPTLLDENLLPRIVDGELDVVLLSGNPGDGKTSVLFQLGEQLKQLGAVVLDEDAAGYRLSLDGRTFTAVFDASESHGDLTSDDLVHNALRPVVAGEKATALIAVNDGRLLSFFTRFDDEYELLAMEVNAQLEGRAAADSRVALVDLKRRSLASIDGQSSLAGRALAKLTSEEFWSVCKGCIAKNDCPILANRDLLHGDGSSTFDELTLISHLRRRRRATFRDVRSAAAWIITGDHSCEDVHAWRDLGLNALGLPRSLAYDLAFDADSNDYLIDEWADLDPSRRAAPRVDHLKRTLTAAEAARFPSIEALSRAIYFRDGRVPNDGIAPAQLRAYRYQSEFVEMLTADGATTQVRDRLLTGASRLVGAFGYGQDGLAISSGMPESAWAILHTVPAEEFSVTVPSHPSPYIESIPDRIELHHESGPHLSLTLDTAEILLRAADGEVLGDAASEAIRQEIEGFASQLGRQPSMTAQIVDSSGSVRVARVEGQAIVLGAR